MLYSLHLVGYGRQLFNTIVTIFKRSAGHPPAPEVQMLPVSIRRSTISVIILLCLLTSSDVTSKAAPLNLRNAAIVGLQDDSLPAKAAAMLTDEIAKRTGIRLPVVSTRPQSGSPHIEIHTLASWSNAKLPEGLDSPNAADGYAIWIDQSRTSPAVMLLGYDDRATLYAVGGLLRSLSMTKGKVELPANIQVSTVPEVAIRGHQLGYRETNNTYDAWNLEQYEQYIRDQIVFGANAVALIPPHGPQDERSPLMQFPPGR
jgi:hypothetical protein